MLSFVLAFTGSCMLHERNELLNPCYISTENKKIETVAMSHPLKELTCFVRLFGILPLNLIKHPLSK